MKAESETGGNKSASSPMLVGAQLSEVLLAVVPQHQTVLKERVLAMRSCQGPFRLRAQLSYLLGVASRDLGNSIAIGVARS